MTSRYDTSATDRAKTAELLAEQMRRPNYAAKLRPGLPPLPLGFRLLPLDARGYPVPWFVAVVDGGYDFRVIRPGGIQLAHRDRLCWLCGRPRPRGEAFAFVIGPMCAINRMTGEPPSHIDCAQFAVKSCPMMLMPGAQRRVANLPADTGGPAGAHLDRNPGAFLIWLTKSYELQSVENGLMFHIGPPIALSWWREGRRATRAEILESMSSGLPFLEQLARAQGPDAEDALRDQFEIALQLVPAE